MFPATVRFRFTFPATPSSDATRAFRRRSLLLAVAFIAVLPLAWRGTSCGQDFDFHLQNWLEVVHHWRHGILMPHWADSANYLAGEPRFIFYPPLAWIPGAILGLFLPWSWTPVAFALIALLGAGFSFRAMARQWMSRDSATVAACLYIVNPYMLFVLYERGALAELLAATWIPLLILFALRDARPPGSSNLLPLALTVGALWLTNAPAAVMGCYALVPLVAVAAFRQRSWCLVARSAAAVPLGLALVGFWLIPAIFEQRWVQIHRAVGPLLRAEDSFLFGYVTAARLPAELQSAAPYHNNILRTVSWIAVVLIVVAAVAGLLVLTQSRSGGERAGTDRPSAGSRSALVWTAGPLAALVVFLQFPWSAPLWRYLPELRYLQFPWRWLLVLALMAAAFAGLALRREPDTRHAIAVRGAVVVVLACGMALLSALLFWQPCDEEDNIPAQIAAFKTTGFPGTDEYTPGAAINDKIQQDLPLFRLLRSARAEESPTQDNPEWAADPRQEMPGRTTITRANPEHLTAFITTAASGYAVVRLMDYPAWRVTINGSELQSRPHRADGLLALPIGAGTTRIDIRWQRTPDQIAGIALTLVALAITLAVTFGRRLTPHPPAADR